MSDLLQELTRQLERIDTLDPVQRAWVELCAATVRMAGAVAEFDLARDRYIAAKKEAR